MRVSRFVNVNTSSHRRLFIITLYVCCHNTYRPARSWRFPPSRVCLCITPDHTAYPPSRFLFVSADWCLVFCMLILSVLSILYTYCVEYYVVFHGPYQSYSAFSFCSVSLSFIFLISSFHASSVRWSGYVLSLPFILPLHEHTLLLCRFSYEIEHLCLFFAVGFPFEVQQRQLFYVVVVLHFLFYKI